MLLGVDVYILQRNGSLCFSSWYRVDISEHSSDAVLLASESSLRVIQSCGVVLKFRFG